MYNFCRNLSEDMGMTNNHKWDVVTNLLLISMLPIHPKNAKSQKNLKKVLQTSINLS